jgi:hypothetical protein
LAHNFFSSFCAQFHAIRGRIIAFTVLRAFYEGLKMWEESPDKKLPEEVWHVKNHYDNIRTKLKNVKEEDSFCFNFKELEPKSLCTTPFNVSFLPRWQIACGPIHLILRN